MRNKTDRNNARGIAELVRLGWFRKVFVKSDAAQRTRMLLVSRSHLLGKSQDIENCIRGSLKVFGLRIGAVTKKGFEDRVLELVAGDQSLIAIVKPLLRARCAIIEAFERLGPSVHPACTTGPDLSAFDDSSGSRRDCGTHLCDGR